MSISSINSQSSQAIQQLVTMRAQFDDLQRQLSTGQKSTTYAGLGLGRGVAVSFNSQLSAISGYDSSISNVMPRIDVMNTVLGSMNSAVNTVKQAMITGSSSGNSTGVATAQSTALSSLDQILSQLNTRAGDTYVFSGKATNTPAVETTDHILNGNGAKAGLKQLISERNQADLGANGLGRLVVPAASTSPAMLIGSGATLTPDAPAVMTGTANIGALTSAGGTLVINGTSVAIGAGDNATTIMGAINGAAAGVTASLDANNNLVLTSADAATAVDVGAGSSAGLLTELGLTVSTANPTNLLTQGAVTAGQDLTLTVGLNPTLTITFGNGVGQVSTMAQLQTALGGLTGGTATVNPLSGDISATAANTTDSITVGGTATAANFGLTASVASPTAGTRASVSEDVAGSIFGFKLASVGSTLTGATTTGPAGVPPAITVDFSGGNPNEGDAITLGFNLPDGTTENLKLTATTTSPPGPNQFTIGATPDATAANFQAALTTGISDLAGTSLTAASAVQASNEFFAGDANTPPQRVNGPPFSTATGLIAGTAANTMIWYTGEAGSTNARSTATAQIDPSLTVSFGSRANEDGIRSVVQNIATLAAVTVSPGASNRDKVSSALNQRLNTNLIGSPGSQTLDTIQVDLGTAQAAMNDAKTRHQQASSQIAGYLDQVTGVSNETVSAEILALQNRMQASMQTTAMLFQTSLLNYLPRG